MMALFDKENWDDTDCITAWEKLRSQHDLDEIFWAIYGGLLKKDIKFTGYVMGLNRHHKNTHIIEFDFQQGDLVEEKTVLYEPKVTVDDLKKIIQNHTI